MIGGDKPPFRSPCGGTSSAGFIFGARPLGAPALVHAFGNTTQMLDHCGNIIGVTSRLYQAKTCGGLVCDTDCNDCPGGTNLVTNTPNPPAISANTWEENGTVQVAPAAKRGQKQIQAFKYWHGRWGFLDNCSLPTPPPNTKYLTIDVSWDQRSYDNTGDDPEGYAHFYGVSKMSVNRYTGERTLLECESTYEYVNPDLSVTPLPGGPGSELITDMAIGCEPSWWAAIEADFTGGGGHYASASRTISQTVHQIDFVPSVKTDDLEFHGTITLSDPYTINDNYADTIAQAEVWSLTDDLKNPFRTDNHTTVAPLVLRSERTETVQPSMQFTNCTSDDLTMPIADADSNAPFSEDWTPTYQQRAWFDPSFYVWTFAPGTDQSNAAAIALTPLFDGSFIGSPLAAGYGQSVGGHPRGVFDRDHEQWFHRNCVFGSGWSSASEARGLFTPGYLPANAPKWTDDFVATTLYPCAFVSATDDGCYLQKWSEIKLARVSLNCARPYGPDKFLLDETAVYFVSNYTAPTVTLKNTDFTDPSSLPFVTGDIVGSAAVGGFYHVSSVGSNTVTLGAKVYDPPSGWNTPSRDGAACFGKLRWPNAPGMDFTDTTPEVGGRGAISVVTEGPPSQLTTETTQKYLSITTPENIDILDKDLVVLASNVPATRVDDGHFTVTTAYATISTAKWIVPRVLNDGATLGTKYKFADNRPKGDYVYRAWLVDTGTATVLASSQSQHCLKSNPCGPPIAGITPNGEALTNADFFPFPCTVQNGQVWLAQFQFWMVDPYWQQPHTPVAASAPGTEDMEDGTVTFVPGTDIIIWKEDDGSCAADYTEDGGGGETIYHLFYAMRPYVEARISMPTGISGDDPPALPPGTIDITLPATPPGQAFLANVEGLLVDAIVLPPTPLSLMLAQQGCVDGAGRFAADYEANGTTPS